MNKYIVILAVALMAYTVNAQTNVVSTVDTNAVSNVTTNVTEKEFGNWELTLGGGGETINGKSEFGLDFSLSTNPLKARPEVWFGVEQSLYWTPAFAGSTDLYAGWSQNIWKEKLYLNGGWTVGNVYDTESYNAWRTGPELTVQFYTSDHAFIFAGANYDVWRSRGDETLRYSFGIGLHW